MFSLFCQRFRQEQPGTARRATMLAVIGVMTAFDGPTESHYRDRRAALRETWFPADSQRQLQLELQAKLVVGTMVDHLQAS